MPEESSQPAQLVAAAAARLPEYVFPDRGAAAADHLRRRLADGAYAGLRDGALCAALTDDLAGVCADRHLLVRWRATPVDPAAAAVHGRERYREQLAARGFGVRRAARLGGGVGLLELTDVGPAEWVAGALGAAFGVLAGSRALLLDLRANPGGTPDGAALICSFLLPPEPVQVNAVHAADGSVRQYWSWPWLPGPRLTGPVWVLTSARTFSGAEEVAYNLRALGRATLVGEVTAGGAHPVTWHPLSPQATLQLPHARSVNPVTGANWEGIGVTPDVAVPAAGAEEAALRLARQHLAG